MAEFFSDALTEQRMTSYWHVMRDLCTITEWEYACRQAMGRETFHKTPLPAQLMDYVREYRKGTRELYQRAEMADGSHTPEQLLQLREPLEGSENVRKLLASIWPEDRP